MIVNMPSWSETAERIPDIDSKPSACSGASADENSISPSLTLAPATGAPALSTTLPVSRRPRFTVTVPRSVGLLASILTSCLMRSAKSMPRNVTS